jgi:hypothetical protein
MDKQTFELGDNDCAIVIKQDMSVEMVLPKMADEDRIDGREHQNVYITMAITASMADKPFKEVINAKLDEMFKTLSKEEAETAAVVPTCACGSESTCEGC